MHLFRETYRVESLRLPGRDYAAPGMYFVTLCTAGQHCWFGEIRNRMMGLNNQGCIVADEIQGTALVRQNVIIDRWVIMPNHVHVIIVIQTMDDVSVVETSRRDVSTNVAELIPLFRFRARSLGSVVNHIKSACTKRIRAMGHDDFAWQSGFYDHIVRNEKSLSNIQQYILNNPINWKKDRNN